LEENEGRGSVRNYRELIDHSWDWNPNERPLFQAIAEAMQHEENGLMFQGTNPEELRNIYAFGKRRVHDSVNAFLEAQRS
jgi:hypothetical protein